MAVSRTGDWARARRLLTAAPQRLQAAIGTAVRQEAHALRNEIVQGLTRQAPGGEPLKPPSPLTIAARELEGFGGTKALIVRGDLRNSITVVVQGEGNYSDAHIFPYVFQKLGVGKLVGAPVAGTGTAVWWERQIDPTIVFGVPQVGFVTEDGRYLENLDLEPDVLVLSDPEAAARGDDPQLDKAVEVLLAELK